MQFSFSRLLKDARPFRRFFDGTLSLHPQRFRYLSSSSAFFVCLAPQGEQF
jgi:hypothetical protein